MWFVEYFIAGDPLPKTCLVRGEGPSMTPEEVCKVFAFGSDLMKLTMTWVQTEDFTYEED